MLIDKQGGSKIGSRNRRWFSLSQTTVSAQSASMRPNFWSLTCAWLSSRSSLPSGQWSLVDSIETNILLLVTLILAPHRGFSVIILSPLIFQCGQLSLEFLVFCTCVALRGFSAIGPLTFALNIPTLRQVPLDPRSREAIPELP